LREYSTPTQMAQEITDSQSKFYAEIILSVVLFLPLNPCLFKIHLDSLLITFSSLRKKSLGLKSSIFITHWGFSKTNKTVNYKSYISRIKNIERKKHRGRARLTEFLETQLTQHSKCFILVSHLSAQS
jgi:hypothetical protein